MTEKHACATHMCIRIITYFDSLPDGIESIGWPKLFGREGRRELSDRRKETDLNGRDTNVLDRTGCRRTCAIIDVVESISGSVTCSSSLFLSQSSTRRLISKSFIH